MLGIDYIKIDLIYYVFREGVVVLENQERLLSHYYRITNSSVTKKNPPNSLKFQIFNDEYSIAVSLFFLPFCFLLYLLFDLQNIIIPSFRAISRRDIYTFLLLGSGGSSPPGCANKNAYCIYWSGYCSYHQYVRANCKKTCNLC